VTTGNGNNKIALGGGADTVTVGKGNNTIALGNGNDHVTAGDGNNEIMLGDGADTATVGNGKNTIVLGNGDDHVTAGNGNNEIMLGGGADTMTVGKGNNTIVLGRGHDTMTTGNGRDVLVFTGPSGLLTLEFEKNDELVFTNSGFDLGGDDDKPSGRFGFDDVTRPRPIPAALFSSKDNGTFAAASNRFAYDQGTGQLYYDPKGNAPGSTAYLIADLTNKPHLTAANLFFTG
jgi:Ca2+-binding RTX toxin-like protein